MKKRAAKKKASKTISKKRVKQINSSKKASKTSKLAPRKLAPIILKPSASARSASASAPGKILWLGGYSVLEKGNCSLVSAVDKRVYATATAFKQIVLSSPQYEFQVAAQFDKKTGKLVLEKEVPAAKFLAKATEVALCYLTAKKVPLKNFFLQTKGDDAFGVGGGKSGLGSSAAATAATVACVLSFHGLKFSEVLVHNLSQIAHSLAQGKVGSGFDIAAACFGSCSYSRYSPALISNLGESPSPRAIAELAESEWDYSYEKIFLPSELRLVLANIEGTSASTTEMVKLVMEWKKKSPEEYAALIEELDGANLRAISCLKKRDWTGFQTHFMRTRELTHKLGLLTGAQIEPPILGELVDESIRNGAFVCKLPGAGGGDSIVALCLNEFGERKLRTYWRSQVLVHLKILELNASSQGVSTGSGTMF